VFKGINFFFKKAFSIDLYSTIGEGFFFSGVCRVVGFLAGSSSSLKYSNVVLSLIFYGSIGYGTAYYGLYGLGGDF
jgi:hypothetical protein